MIFKFSFELLEGLVAGGLDFSSCDIGFKGFFDLIGDVKSATVVSLEVCAADPEDASTLDFLTVERIVDEGNDVLLLNFFEMLFNLLTQR